MPLSKRERVIRALERDDEPDMVPIQYSGFEKSNTAYHEFLKTDYYSKNKVYIKNNYSRKKNHHVGDITEQRFFNVDCHGMDPFGKKIKFKKKRKLKTLHPPEYPNCELNPMTGKLRKVVKIQETGKKYSWYIGGYFTTPEILHSYWDDYGKPSENIDDRVNYSLKVWDNFVDSLSDYFYPIAPLGMGPFEALFEGMTLNRVGYFMRKKPTFIHEVMMEYAKVNLEIIKRLSEAGVDVVFLFDDLGYKGRSILSHVQFREFILPYYKKIYEACKKNGMFIVQHSCGYIDELLPDIVDAGLDCIQALEPSAGVDLAHLKKTLGDKLSFMGGMDSSPILNFGTPQDIEEEVKRCIKAAAAGGGYFAGPSHNILNTPWENVLTLRAAIEKHRNYPLKI